MHVNIRPTILSEISSEAFLKIDRKSRVHNAVRPVMANSCLSTNI